MRLRLFADVQMVKLRMVKDNDGEAARQPTKSSELN